MAEGSKEEDLGKPIFTREERRDLVKRFIGAFLGGQVKVLHPSKDELKEHPEIEQAVAVFGGVELPPSAKALVDVDGILALYMRQDFDKHISIVTGAIAAAPKEVEDSINRIFETITAYRGADRIEGDFWAAAKYEDRLALVEDAATKTTLALEGIKSWMQRFQRVLEEAEKDYKNQLGKIGGTEKAPKE